MKRILTLMLVFALLALFAGCSDDDDDKIVDPGGDTTVDTTIYNAGTGVFTTTIDGSSHTEKAYYSMDEHAANPTMAAAVNWDLSFQRTNINLNGGAGSDDSRNVVGAVIMDKAFENVTIADTTGLVWAEDTAKLVVDAWYIYNSGTHQLDMTRNVYTMIDAEGDNYIKFQVDSVVDGGMPPDMGTLWMTYYYNPTANSTALSGTVTTGSINVGAGTGYFDFSAGAQVTPSNPSSSNGWDIAVSNYEIMLNGGSSGNGGAMAFPMYGELNDPTDIEEVTMQPPSPMFTDFLNSIFAGDLFDDSRNWYDYDGVTHLLTSKGYVYLVKTDIAVYAVEIVTYYGDFGGTPQSGVYTFDWKEL